VPYTPQQWDQIAIFLKNLAAAMRNAVAALDDAYEEQEAGPVVAVKATTGEEGHARHGSVD
jgi:hypothetical protein